MRHVDAGAIGSSPGVEDHHIRKIVFADDAAFRKLKHGRRHRRDAADSLANIDRMLVTHELSEQPGEGSECGRWRVGRRGGCHYRGCAGSDQDAAEPQGFADDGVSRARRGRRQQPVDQQLPLVRLDDTPDHAGDRSVRRKP